jgi:hypothetical protein
VHYQRNNRRGNDCRNSGDKEKGNAGDQRPYCSRERPETAETIGLRSPSSAVFSRSRASALMSCFSSFAMC